MHTGLSFRIPKAIATLWEGLFLLKSAHFAVYRRPRCRQILHDDAYAFVGKDFSFPVPVGLDDVHVVPFRCAGIIGFRRLVLHGVMPFVAYDAAC